MANVSVCVRECRSAARSGGKGCRRPVSGIRGRPDRRTCTCPVGSRLLRLARSPASLLCRPFRSRGHARPSPSLLLQWCVDCAAPLGVLRAAGPRPGTALCPACLARQHDPAAAAEAALAAAGARFVRTSSGPAAVPEQGQQPPPAAAAAAEPSNGRLGSPAAAAASGPCSDCGEADKGHFVLRPSLTRLCPTCLKRQPAGSGRAGIRHVSAAPRPKRASVDQRAACLPAHRPSLTSCSGACSVAEMEAGDGFAGHRASVG